MRVSATTRSHLVKALRVLLVFSLVFWSTFRVEMVAFAEGEESETPPAADTPIDNADTGNTDDQGTDRGENQGQGQGEGQGDGQNQGDGQGQDGNQGQGNEGQGGQQQGEQGGQQGDGQGANPAPATEYDRLEIRLFDEKADTKQDPFANRRVFVASNSADNPQKEENVPKIETRGGTLKLSAVLVSVKEENGAKTVVGQKDVTGDVEWYVENEPTFIEAADFESRTVGSNAQAILRAKGKSDARIMAVCAIKGDKVSSYHLKAGEPSKVEFAVTVKNQTSGLVVDKIELLGKDGGVLSASSTLDIPYDDAKKEATYQFAARLTVRDTASQEKKAEYTIATTNAENLSDDEKKLLENLTWSVDDGPATIDATGLFSTKAKMETYVRCSYSDGGDGAVVQWVKVNTGIDNAVQGEYFPQDSLRIVAPSSAVKAEGEEAAQAETGERDGQATQPGNSDEKAEGNPDDVTADGEAAQAPDGPDPIDEVFSAERVQGVSPQLKESRSYAGGSSSSGTTTILGEGPTLKSLLEEAGVDPAKVEKVTLYDRNGASYTMSWSAAEDAIVAVNSVVLSDGQDADGADVALLKNTRFRLLPSGEPSLGDAHSWIKTICVNDADVNGKGSGKTKDESLRPIIFYNPVPVGYSAVLTAAVVGLYQGEQFGLAWQVSDDGGASWSATIEESQTIRVPVSGNLGRMYRVTVTTNNGRVNESEPVTIREPNENDFSVNLAFDPPLAGEMAFFNTKVFGVKPAEITDYIWEWTEDGGDTWQEIAGSRGNPSFSAKTDPVDAPGGDADEEGAGTGSEGEGASSGDSEAPGSEKEVDKTPASSMWIHVRVLATGGREAVSNPVMLTVHVNDDPGSGQAATDDIPDELNDEPSAPGSDDEVNPPTENDGTEPSEPADPNASATDAERASEPASEPVVHEVSSITTETAPRSQSQVTTVAPQTSATEQTPDGTETAPTPESAASDSPTDLVINPQVTAEILEQREAVNAAVQATHPGARWTALTTVDPDGKDIQRILNDNPFVPFTAPFALGITAAGFVEKLLGFRRQVR